MFMNTLVLKILNPTNLTLSFYSLLYIFYTIKQYFARIELEYKLEYKILVK